MRRDYRTDAVPPLQFPPGGVMAGNRKGPTKEAREQGKRAGSVGKRIVLDTATWQSLDVLARDRMMTFQELADEALLDLLRKHGRPYDTRDAFRRSARLAQANENKAEKPSPKSKRPAKGRARS
jgi:hypothetical protein